MKKISKLLSILLCLSFALSILSTAVFAAKSVTGDLTGDGVVDRDDAIYLLYHSIYPNDYSVDQSVDYVADGEITREDAIYLLYHSIYPNDYPLDDSEQPFVYSVPLTSSNIVVGNDIASFNQNGSAYVETGSIVAWSIPQVMLGDTVTVTIKGSSVGNFRVWLLTSGQGTYSNQFKSADQNFSGGDFEYTFELTAADADAKGEIYANAIAFKAPSWDAQLNKLLIESVEITYPVEEDDDVPSDPTGKSKWVASWGSAQLTAGAEHLPKNLSLANNTVRQQIRMTLGGETARFVFSNEFGRSDLVIKAANVAHLLSPSSSIIDTTTTTNITFNGGSTSVTIPAGQTVTSDEISIKFQTSDDLAVSMYLGSVPTSITSHTASRCSTWVASGNVINNTTVSGEVTTAWYFLSRVDVAATEDCKAIVCLGDSLTDGASVTTNEFSRWPDELARQLKTNGYKNYSVINMGIGATPLMNSWGENGVKRFSRDVLNVPGVDSVIILYGVNDIGGANSDISQNIINTYKNMITQCHAKGIKVYGCTITPFLNPNNPENNNGGYYSPLHEEIRIKVNNFIRSADSGFDGYIDTAAAVADPSNTKQMQRQYVSVWGDWLHFNDTGYKFVGKTIYDAICVDLNK